jgi:hypothetical protein
VTERERLDRETLLRRAAVAAGAVYLAPMLTSGAVASSEGQCPDVKCRRRKHRRACRRAGCFCDRSAARCQPAAACKQDPDCPSHVSPCGVIVPCGSGGTCVCLHCVLSGGGIGPVNCMNYRSNFCSEYPPCKKSDGSGCPPGHTCYDSCCPEGICEVDCTTSAAPKIGRSVGSGPMLTL